MRFSRRLGKNRATLRKRWPGIEQQSTPLRWLHEHATPWRQTLRALLDEIDTGSHPLPPRLRETTRTLRHALDDTSWQALLDTPEQMRSLLGQLTSTEQDRPAARDAHALLADYDNVSGKASNDQ
ncbi:hypothetical protein [Actinopolyspora halophila]|uniref:hypothetical protein n=1 Tax=Actinopolyspora halophila TaxID=1850 RepID=UPI00035ED13D|nr:hypothetical protein [Actinopolyspora halophila]